MSRYCIKHETKGQTYWISFGWDRPTSTFFAQVEPDESEASDDLDEPDELLLDMGSPFDCLYTHIEKFHDAFLQRLHELGVDDFALSMEQKLQLLADKDGIGN